MIKPSLKQQEIINYLEGSLLVTAGPGSGKTKVITLRIEKIIRNCKGKILTLTFSNKAAEELKKRLKETISGEEYNRIYVGTIHSFCLDIIINKGHQIGLPSGLTVIEQESDKLELLKKAFMENNIFANEEIIKATLNEIKKFKELFIDPSEAKTQEEKLDLINIYETYNNLLISNRLLDFDDILFYSYKILVEKPNIAKNYMRFFKYLLIDEAQDLNQNQYNFIKSLTIEFKNLMMVGDPDQSIYGFNGSNSEIMTKIFVKDFNPKKFHLNDNYRSSSKIINAARKIKPLSKSESVYPIEGKLEIKEFKNEDEESLWIANKIEKLIEEGSKWTESKLEFTNIAIIARNNYLFASIKTEFNKREIPYKSGNINGVADFETLEMKFFELAIRVIANPYDVLHYNQINDIFKRKSSKSNYLIDILNNDEINNDEINKDIILEIMESLKIIVKNFEQFNLALDKLDGIVSKNENLDSNFRFIFEKDLEVWKKRWKKYCNNSVHGNRNLTEFRNEISLGKLNQTSNYGISLLTVHMSKGLEFEIVFIIGMNQGTFPDYRVKSEISKIEEKNNIFVAITRARRECYLTYVKWKLMPWGDNKQQFKSEYLKLIE